LKEPKNELIGEVEEEQESLSEEESALRECYTKQFIYDDLNRIIFYCTGWNGTNGICFNGIQPEDIVFKVLELICEGRRKCYTESYRNFRNSVYMHVKFELLTYFNCRKKEKMSEDSPENGFTETAAEVHFDEALYADKAENVLGKFERKDIREAIKDLFDPNEDIDELSVLDLIFLGYKRWEVAEDLKITVAEVTNIQKRIIRRIIKHFDINLLKGDI
jgi:hypothetical protein